ncbi:MAG TPA: CsiV family protein [Steroidobacteraceae bacterium]|jgi:hypothetical protein
MTSHFTRRQAARIAAFAALGVGAVLVPTAPAVSQDANATTYNIELIVFRANSSVGGPENWSAEGGANDSTVAGEEANAETSQAANVGRFVAVLPATGFQLNDIENRLKSSGAYTPVAHIAWSQTASAWGTRAGFPIQRLGADAPGLSGTVFLERGQYLHLGVSLSYASPSPPAGIGAAPGTTFVMNQSRRVRFYERNYYDHPAFGVIALVTPTQGKRPPGR